MKISKLKCFLFLIVLVGFTGCDVFNPGEVNDPNDPSVSEVQQNATKLQIQDLLTAMESRNRNSTVSFARFIGTFGREVIPMFASEARNLDIIYGLSKGASAETNPNFYGNGSAWNGPYSTIKQANLIIQVASNTDNLSDQERNGFVGVAKTFKAYAYLMPLLTQSKENGIRLDVNDPLNPGPFVKFKQALAQVRDILNDARNDLEQAGNVFAFDFTDGLSDFSTPQTFENLNRAIEARAAIYDEDWSGALDLLNAAKPFFELASGEETLQKGAYFVYGGPPDSFNPRYNPHNVETSGIVMVDPSMITGAETGDERVSNKFFKRDEPIVVQGLSAYYQDDRFQSNTSSFPWITNEELILIYAEANAQLDNLPQANKAINYVRSTWGLSDFTNTQKSNIINQILYERQYSLWGEFGHRWIDAKRYDRLDQLPKNKGQIYKYLARPQSEVSWDELHH